MTIKLPSSFVDKCHQVARDNITHKKRKCTCCGRLKPLGEFYTQSYTGIPTNQCKECINVKRSVVRHKAKHGKFVSKEKQRNMERPDYDLQDWMDAMIHFEGKCCYCGKSEGRAKKAKHDREHLIPVSRGGKTVRNNIVPACPQCNRARGNKELFSWFRSQPSWTQDREDRIVAWMQQEVKNGVCTDNEQ